jgi:hypothetical protein
MCLAVVRILDKATPGTAVSGIAGVSTATHILTDEQAKGSFHTRFQIAVMRLEIDDLLPPDVEGVTDESV